MHDSIRQRGLAVLLALAMLLTGVMVVLAQGGEGTQVLGGDEESLRALLARVAESYGPDGGQSEIEVGAVTARLPFSLPLPDDAQVLGSISDLRAGEPYHIQVIATSALDPAAIAAFYEDALSADPWRSMREATGPVPGGFTTQQTDWANFCYGDTAMLQVSAREVADGGADLRFHIQFSPLPDLCTSAANSTEIMGNAFSLLPTLLPPDGVTQLSSSAGSGGSSTQQSVYSAATLETSLDLDTLHAAYAAQLEAAGWNRLDREIGTRLAWSAWRLMDEQGHPWEGTLTIAASASMPQIQIQLNLNQLPAS